MIVRRRSRRLVYNWCTLRCEQDVLAAPTLDDLKLDVEDDVERVREVALP